MSEIKNAEVVLKPFLEALTFWNAQLEGPLKDVNASIPAAKVQHPLTELEKLLELMKAQITKVGIVYEPKTLKKQTDAAHSTAADLSRTFVLYMSAVSQMSMVKVSKMFLDEIVDSSRKLVLTALEFVEELRNLYKESKADAEESDKKNEGESSSRLLSIGKLWSLCDSTKALIGGGELKVLELKVRLSLSLIEDGLEDFTEWAENPEEVDDEDPFGLEEDFSDEENETNDAEESNSLNGDEKESESFKNLRDYSKNWVQKLKLIKLLLLSIKKSVPSIIQGSDIDRLHSLEASIASDIDMLIAELMMNRVLDHRVESHAKKVDDECFSIIKILKDLNKSDESKVKWCGSWNTKYTEFSEEQKKLLDA